jgi:hypothetical protein
MRKRLIVVFGYFFICLSVSNGSAEEAPTILIVDATAQMSARLGQHRKIDLVKNTLGALMRPFDPSSSLALWAFGTNSGKKCEGKSELVPLQSANTARHAIVKSLAPIQPRAARAPVFGTVQSALKALDSQKDKPASVVLIAGTGDDCIPDICKAAQELHGSYPNVKLTILGMGMNEQAAAKYTCAAKAMGGSVTIIKSSSDFEKVLRQTLNIGQNSGPAKAATTSPAPQTAQAVSEEKSGDDKASATSNASPPDTPAAPVQKAQEKPAAPQPPQPEPNTILSAALSAGQPPLDMGVTWSVFKVTTTPTGQVRTAETPTWIGGGGQAKIKLTEGRYLARAVYGFASASAEFTVGGEKAEKTIDLQAGSIMAEALQAKDGQPSEAAFFTLYRGKPGAREEVGRSSEAPALFHVGAGDYTLSASLGPAKLDTAVKVEAGKVSSVKVALNVGTLEIKTFEIEGSSRPIPALHMLYPANTNANKAGAAILRISGASHRVQLPAGDYRLETVYGNAREEKAITISAGQVSTQNIILNAGEAKINAQGKTEKVCAVFEAGSGNKSDPVGRAAGMDISFILKAGTYDIECHSKGVPTPAKQVQIRVVAGETQSAKIED